MRRFVIFMAVVSLVATAMAQDLLVKRNGEQMRVKVLKITKKRVEFVRYGTELPVYTLPVGDIDYIEYPMGDRDTFGREMKPRSSTPIPEQPKQAEKWHGSVAPPKGSSMTLQPAKEKGAIIQRT